MTREEYARYLAWRSAGAAAKLAHHFAVKAPDATIPPSAGEKIKSDLSWRLDRKIYATITGQQPDAYTANDFSVVNGVDPSKHNTRVPDLELLGRLGMLIDDFIPLPVVG